MGILEGLVIFGLGYLVGRNPRKAKAAVVGVKNTMTASVRSMRGSR